MTERRGTGAAGRLDAELVRQRPTRRFVVLALTPALVLPAGAQAPRASAPPANLGPRTGFEALIGGWSRTDGNYHIVVQSVGAEGVLQAMYFNPNPLPFAQAQAFRESGTVRVQFELRAGGYSGSRYDLRYEPVTDRLTGIYHQAVAKQSYDVEFLRR